MKICSLANIEETTVSHNPKIKKQVLISNGQINTITNFSRAVFPPGEIANTHSHSDMTEVFYIESGQGIISVNDEEFKISPGVCITIEPNEAHELKNTGLSDLTILYFGVRN